MQILNYPPTSITVHLMNRLALAGTGKPYVALVFRKNSEEVMQIVLTIPEAEVLMDDIAEQLEKLPAP